jgi:hypothetical protein
MRDRLLALLRDTVTDLVHVRAAWVGGSEATRRTDALSDIDLQLVVAPEHRESVFAAIEAGLDIAHVWPVSHGDYQQRFYQLNGVPEHLMVDLCLMDPDRLAPYLDPDRHGVPVVWFDHDNLLAPVYDGTVADKMEARRAELGRRHPLLAHIPAKELARGDLVAATAMYHRLLLSTLVELLRMRYCPARWDFGMRYLDRDLPDDVRAEVERLAMPGDPEALGRCMATARAWIEREL